MLLIVPHVPQNGDFQPQTISRRQFSDRLKFREGAVAHPSPPLLRRHSWS